MLFLKLTIVRVITWQAKMVLRKYKPTVVAVTGSVGKTSTKDAIYTVLACTLHARKSAKSFNSEIGVPLTILGLPNGWNNPLIWLRNIIYGFVRVIYCKNYPKWLVLEVGADRPGDIKKIATWLEPDYVVVTRMSGVPAHVEYFATPSDIIAEKANLVSAVKKGGTVILNKDDTDVLKMQANIPVENNVNVITYGFDPESDYVAIKYGALYNHTKAKKPKGVVVSIKTHDELQKIEFNGSIGRGQVYSALCATAMGSIAGVSLKMAGTALEKHVSTAGRMRLLDGVKKTTIIDDSYNSSPIAVSEALSSLANIVTLGRKIVILGDMLELGKYSGDEHKKAGQNAGNIADYLITVGFRARGIAEGALIAGMSEKNIFQFEDAQKAGKHVELMLQENDIVLIKGSQSMRMERAVEEIMANPQDKQKLLVRQEIDWLKR